MIKILLILAATLLSNNAFAAPVNVNTADAKTIADSLKGIGLKKAEAIVEYRSKNGDFKIIDDLSHVSGIGAKTIEKNKGDILLADPSAPTQVPLDTTKEPATSESGTKPEKNSKKVETHK
jgi:competence protein ComEA